MTQKDKELLLKDLCARLPYEVKVTIEYTKGKYTHVYDLRKIDNDITSELRQRVTVWNYGLYNTVISYLLIDCKPYLRSMSSMTEEEAREIGVLHDIKNILSVKVTSDYIDYIVDDGFSSIMTMTRWYDELISSIECLDWLNSKHFDYRGLISKGLAVEVTEENNPYEK